MQSFRADRALAVDKLWNCLSLYLDHCATQSAATAEAIAADNAASESAEPAAESADATAAASAEETADAGAGSCDEEDSPEAEEQAEEQAELAFAQPDVPQVGNHQWQSSSVNVS